MAALLQLFGSSGESAISAWNTVTITMINQFLLFYFVLQIILKINKELYSPSQQICTGT